MPTRVVWRERSAEISTSGRRIGGNAPSTFSIKSFTRKESQQNEEDQVPQQPRTASDISSSPRLSGYFFTWIACGVMLASVLQFFQNENRVRLFQSSDKGYRAADNTQVQLNGSRTDSGEGNDDFVKTPFDSSVLRWKLYGALTVSIVGIIVYLLIMLAHLDTLLFPKLWKSNFKDGSHSERNLLYLLLVFWAAALHICTSSFSVGYVQPNVYFTCWFCFVTNCMTINVWRVSANVPTIGSQKTSRKTTHNWRWTCIFTLATALALLDVYSNRTHFTFYKHGELYKPPTRAWIRGLILTFGTFLLSAAVILANSTLDFSYKLMRCFLWDPITIDWKVFEGIILMGILGLWGWMTIVFTGVSGAVNGPGNVYFGIWCTFFSTIFTLGTWVKELGLVDLHENEEAT